MADDEGGGHARHALAEDELRQFLEVVDAEWRLFFEFPSQTGCGSARQSSCATGTSKAG
jgi:hypothetical protein